MPAISVIVPVYQAEALLPQCVESVLAQTFSDWELLLIDDGSRDGSPTLCDATPQETPAFACSTSPTAACPPPEIWAGAGHGPYIAFLDADDTFEPAALETLSENLSERRGSPDVLVSPCWGCRDDGLQDGEYTGLDDRL